MWTRLCIIWNSRGLSTVSASLFQRPPLEVFQHPLNAAGVVVAV